VPSILGRKKILAVAGALAAFGTLTASAASLGGMSSTSLGSSATVVASCDTDGIAIAYPAANTTWDATSNDYRTYAITLSGVNAACEAKSFKLTLSSASAALNETAGTVTLTSGTQTVTLSGTAGVRAQDVARAALVITG
jgi:hypothetical protein